MVLVQDQGVQLLAGHQLGIVLEVDLVAIGLRPGDVRRYLGLGQEELVAPAERADVVLALVVHAAHQRVDVGHGTAGQGAVAVDRDLGS